MRTRPSLTQHVCLLKIILHGVAPLFRIKMYNFVESILVKQTRTIYNSRMRKKLSQQIFLWETRARGPFSSPVESYPNLLLLASVVLNPATSTSSPLCLARVRACSPHTFPLSLFLSFFLPFLLSLSLSLSMKYITLEKLLKWRFFVIGKRDRDLNSPRIADSYVSRWPRCGKVNCR